MFRTIQKRGLKSAHTTKKKRYPTERKKTSIKRNAENELAEPSRKSVVCVFYILHAVHEKQTKSVYMIKGGVKLTITSSPTKHSFIMIQTFYV